MHTIDPGAVLFGGEMTFGGAGSALGRSFLAEVRAEVQRLAFAILARDTAIEFAAFGAEGGVIGAAGLRDGSARAVRKSPNKPFLLRPVLIEERRS